MAEIYPLGENRIFYKASAKLDLPDEVIVELIDTDLNNEEVQVLIPVGTRVPGLYYFEAFFSKEGTYIAIFYERRGDEEPVEKATQAFSTRRIPTINEGRRGRFLGDSVINT